MGIEGLDLQEPVVLPVVLLDEFQPLVKCNRLGGLLFGIHIAAVDRVLSHHSSVRRITQHDLLILKYGAAVIAV